jgi:DNA-binding LacI/PurR family transcriptional regulator
VTDMPTLTEVARAANVSHSTASRALHSARGGVSPKTRDHVTEVARQLGYRRLRGPHRARRPVAYAADVAELTARLVAAEAHIVRLSQVVTQLMRERSGRRP